MIVNIIGRDGSGLLACLDNEELCTSVSLVLILWITFMVLGVGGLVNQKAHIHSLLANHIHGSLQDLSAKM